MYYTILSNRNSNAKIKTFNLLCCPVLVPQSWGTGFAAPVTRKNSDEQTPSASGAPRANSSSSSLIWNRCVSFNGGTRNVRLNRQQIKFFTKLKLKLGTHLSGVQFTLIYYFMGNLSLTSFNFFRLTDFMTMIAEN